MFLLKTGLVISMGKVGIKPQALARHIFYYLLLLPGHSLSSIL